MGRMVWIGLGIGVAAGAGAGIGTGSGIGISEGFGIGVGGLVALVHAAPATAKTNTADNITGTALPVTQGSNPAAGPHQAAQPAAAAVTAPPGAPLPPTATTDPSAAPLAPAAATPPSVHPLHREATTAGPAAPLPPRATTAAPFPPASGSTQAPAPPSPQIARDEWKECAYNGETIGCRDEQLTDGLRIIWKDGLRMSYRERPPRRPGEPVYLEDRYGGLRRRELLVQGNTVLTNLRTGNRILVPLRLVCRPPLKGEVGYCRP